MCAARMAFLLLGLAWALVAPAAGADKYPSRPVRLIAGFPAGGAVDITARVMADWFSADLGQQFVVENRGGSGGNIGAAAVVNSPPDGYTILFDAPNNAISTSLYKKLPFDFIRDTVPVAGVMRLTNIMVIPPSMPIKTVAEFIAYGKANPGKISFASSGNGTSVHMSEKREQIGSFAFNDLAQQCQLSLGAICISLDNAGFGTIYGWTPHLLTKC